MESREQYLKAALKMPTDVDGGGQNFSFHKTKI